VVRALRKSIEAIGRLTKSNLAEVGGEREASDSEEDSSEVSSLDSAGRPEIPLWGTGSAMGEGMRLNESDQNDGGRCG
jgi:hypothetical protein